MFPDVRKAFRACILTSATILLGGCSLAPVIEHHSLDYDTVIEDVSNKSLVTNVLRGRDEAPLYFPDLSQVRGSVTTSAAAQASLPYGPSYGMVTAGPVSASTNPTFDIAPSNTKQFYQGVMNPITKELFAYYVERYRANSDLSTVFWLLVDAIDETKADGSFSTYSFREKKFVEIADKMLQRDAKQGRVIKLPKPTAPDPDAQKQPSVEIKAKDIIDAGAAGFEVSPGTGRGKFRLSKKADKTIICLPFGETYIAVDIEQNGTVKAPGGSSVSTADNAAANLACARLNLATSEAKKVKGVATRYTLHLRSVEQIFFFLGGEIRPRAADTADPLPFYEIQQVEPWQHDPKEEKRQLGCKRLKFFLSPQPVDDARFSVNYRGVPYFVASNAHYWPCDPVVYHGETIQNTQRDNTLRILGILNDLLNLNRDANEIPTTKAVQAVGGGT